MIWYDVLKVYLCIKGKVTCLFWSMMFTGGGARNLPKAGVVPRKANKKAPIWELLFYLICPFPVITYLIVVSSLSPIGPLGSVL